MQRPKDLGGFLLLPAGRLTVLQVQDWIKVCFPQGCGHIIIPVFVQADQALIRGGRPLKVS